MAAENGAGQGSSHYVNSQKFSLFVTFITDKTAFSCYNKRKFFYFKPIRILHDEGGEPKKLLKVNQGKEKK